MLILVPRHAEYKELPLNVGNIKIVKLPTFGKIISKIGYRVYLELIVIPKLARENNIKSLLAFGNFLLTPLKVKKMVLLHHPYIFDDKLFKTLNLKNRIVEGIKRCVFAVTLKNITTLVVQSEYVKSEFEASWPNYSGRLVIIPNPISDIFSTLSESENTNLVHQRVNDMSSLKILYISRFYPHKNHEFLIQLSNRMSELNISHQIFVTLNVDIPGVDEFLFEASRTGCPIVNLGELDQVDIENYYQNSHCLIFPSKSETFGNPMVEAMKYSLPVIAPDLSYASAILGHAGIFYKEDDVEDCVLKIRGVCDINQYRVKSNLSYARFQLFPTVEQWVNKYIELSNER